MPDQPRPEKPPAGDRTMRRAAFLATIIAVPITVLVAVLLVTRVTTPAAKAPTPTPSTAVPSAPVPMTAAPLTADAATQCRAVLARLPNTLRTLPRRTVTAGAEQNAAYGAPAITLACGGAPLTACPPGTTGGDCVAQADRFLMTDGVCWHIRERSDAVAWTTVARPVRVTVTVPNEYAGPAQWANEFSAAVAAGLPARTTNVPWNCG